ncbi:hypothetical protein [Achromobacter sp. Bel]|uniref:hypothetical protein n=1 Tax=Achromobacter sp. Bel TaxID=2727415 RepID=UPI00145FCAA2|nr:hypothetical protein [Achromobacter sp. Bel]NMK49198.1 hypothetical protein [Achromobacter sp. Bel]
MDQEIAARTFRFSVEDKKGRDAGGIEALVTWKNGQLSVLTLWSAWTSSADRNAFCSQSAPPERILPRVGLTALIWYKQR